MATDTLKSGSGNNLLLSNDDASAKIEVKEDGTNEITGSIASDVVTESDGYAFKARWSSSNDNYSAVLGWADGGSDTAVLQLGNNSINEIRAGHVGTGGKFNFIVNNQAAWNATQDGTLALTMNNDGDIYSTAWNSWTPATTHFLGSPSTAIGFYKRIGFMVWIYINLAGTSNDGSFTVNNLPYLIKNQASVYPSIPVGYAQNAGSFNDALTYCSPGSYDLQVLKNDNTAWTDYGTKHVQCSGWYEAESI